MMDISRVIYTAITAGVDTLRGPTSPAAGWSYVCFSESDPKCPPWRWSPIQPGALSPVRQARDIKVNAHRYLPEAQISLWMDGNIEHRADLNDLAARLLEDTDIALHAHPQRRCLYQEAIAVLTLGKDDAERVLPQVLKYARESMPTEAGLYATGVLLRRHTERMADLEKRWWKEIQEGSHRDQISLPFVLRALNVKPAIIDGDIWKGPIFVHRRHDGPAYAKPPQSQADASSR